MGKYKVGKGEHYEAYAMDTLRVMYEADVHKFTLQQFASWSGLPPSGSAREFLRKLVARGWLSVEPLELRSGRHVEVFCIASAVWFGAAKGKS